MSPDQWLGDICAFSLQFAILVAAGALSARFLPIRNARIRLGYWQALLCLCLALPAIQPWKTPPVAPDAGNTVFLLGPSSVLPRAMPSFSLAWLLAALVAGVLGRLLWLLVGLARLRRYRLRARPLSDLRETAGVIRAPHGVCGRTAILLSSDVSGPVTFGFLRPIVLVPSEFVDLPIAQLHAILRHELLHVQRRDWLVVIVEECLRAALWFHPAVHWLIGRIRVCREQVVDREVVNASGARHVYLAALIETVRLSRRAHVPCTLSLGRSSLRARIDLLLKETTMSRSRLIAYTAASAAAIAVAGILAVSWFPFIGEPAESAGAAQVGAEEHDSISVNAGTRLGRAAKVIHRVNPEYPPAAFDAGIKGSVVLEFTIATTGKAKDIRVQTGPAELRQAAVDALGQWRFSPALGSDGKLAESRATAPMTFTIY